jgi:HEAT repeat protein
MHTTMGWFLTSFRFATLAVSLACATAWAQKRPAPLGNAKDNDDEPPKRVVTSALSGTDVALFRGLLFATEPSPIEVRVQAIEDLGFLQDPRALNFLAQLVFDPNPLVWTAALRAIGAMRHPRAEEILSNVIRHPSLGEGQKLKALEFLPFQNTPSALRFIAQLPQGTGIPGGVQGLSRRILLEIPASRGGPR